MTFALALDLFIAGLLILTIAIAGVLNHRLGKLRRDRADLEKLTAEFESATARATEASRNMTVDADSLRDGIEKAQSLHEDLAFLVERAGSTADHLENQIRSARSHGERPAAPRSSASPSPSRSPAPTPVSKMRIAEDAEQAPPRSQAERDLLQALRTAS